MWDERYSGADYAYGTGGPPSAGMMMDSAGLAAELAGLVIEHGVELGRAISEGQHHDGIGAVVQVIARKPA